MYKPENVFSEIKNGSSGEIDRIVLKSHHTPEDFEDGDLMERIDRFYYYHLIEIKLSSLDKNEFDVCEDRVDKYVKMIEDKGMKDMPNIIVDQEFSIIDGIHRLNSMTESGIDTAKVYIGSEISLKEMFKRKQKQKQRLRIK